MKEAEKIFKFQVWHLLSLGVLISVMMLYLRIDPSSLEGEVFDFATEPWLWIAVAVPIIHQVYVWLIWRLELYGSFFTKRFGLQKSFGMYSAGFSILFVGRLITIIILAYSNRNTLNMNVVIARVLISLITPLVLYLFYSVKKYFTVERAYGIDHFDKHYNKPYVKKGIFKFTNNGMYIFGFLVLYLPGLIFLSRAAILVALFNHLYIWVHFFFTERPDMSEIYGDTP